MMESDKTPIAIQNILDSGNIRDTISAEIDVNPPIIMERSAYNDSGCSSTSQERVKALSSKPNESTLAKQIRELSDEIRNITDCEALEQQLYKATASLQDDLDQIKTDVKKRLGELMPLLKVPLNPFKLPKYIVKQAIGRILPDVRALTKLIQRIAQVSSAINELVKVSQEVQHKLDQCLITTDDRQTNQINNVIESETRIIEDKISSAIARSICKGADALGITAEDLGNVVIASKMIDERVKELKSIQNSADQAVNENIAIVGSYQSTLEELTGVPSPFDTSNTSAFFASANSTTYSTWESTMTDLSLLPEPVIVVSPEITGNAIVGSTLICSNGVWSNGTVNTDFQYSFQWYRNGQEIPGANSYVYTVALDDFDYKLKCAVNAENQTNIEQSMSNETDVVEFRLLGANAPVITGVAQNSQFLTCSTGVWPMELMSPLQYEFYSDNVLVQSRSAQNQYYTSIINYGKTITCKVYGQSSRYFLSTETDGITIN